MNSRNLLVLSDTHGNLPALEAVLHWAGGRAIDTAVFLGDGDSDLAPASAAAGFICRWEKVRGNGDYNSAVPESAALDFSGCRFFLTHGHRYALYNGYCLLGAAARKAGANAALFGHTHVPFLNEEDGVLLINPGSVGRPRSRIGATFAVIECGPAAQNPPAVHFFGIGSGGNIQEVQIH
jgi:putative phosphoesterase